MTEIKFTVLIVEDEENIGNFISTILKTNGYKPIIATQELRQFSAQNHTVQILFY